MPKSIFYAGWGSLKAFKDYVLRCDVSFVSVCMYVEVGEEEGSFFFLFSSSVMRNSYIK